MPDNSNIILEERKITTLSPKDTTEIKVRLMDFCRLYRSVEAIKPPAQFRELFAGICWGITAAAALNLIVAWGSDPIPAKQYFATNSIAGGFFLIVGLVLWFSLNEQSKDVADARSSLIQDFKDVHKLYYDSDEDLDIQSGVKSKSVCPPKSPSEPEVREGTR